MTQAHEDPVVGILAGGAGRRMGGVDKGRLQTKDGERLLPRLLQLCNAQGAAAVVLGGGAVPGVTVLPDEPSGIGPMGGLSALLAHAGARPAVLLACDLPYLDASLLCRLLRAPCADAVLAARDPRTGKWQPMFARYDSPRVLPPLREALAAGVRSFQTFLRTQAVSELPLDDAERARLRDWDTPEDIG